MGGPRTCCTIERLQRPTSFCNLPCSVLTTTQALAMRQVLRALQVVAAVVLNDASRRSRLFVVIYSSCTIDQGASWYSATVGTWSCWRQAAWETVGATTTGIARSTTNSWMASSSTSWVDRLGSEISKQLDAELAVNDENSSWLLEFYVQEGSLLQEEVRQLDRSSGGESTSKICA